MGKNLYPKPRACGRHGRGRHLEKRAAGEVARDEACASCKQREMDEEKSRDERGF